MEEKKCRIVLVDDHPIVRGGLAQMMSQQPDLEVCGEAESAEQALEVIAGLRPDLAIVDIFMEGTNGIELTKMLRSRYPDMPVLILSMHDEALYAERALRAGALGYVMKHEASRNIMDAVRTVMSGKRYVSGSVADMPPDADSGGDNSVSDDEIRSLSQRELAIFRLIGQGASRGMIAEELNISIKTVETHRANMKYKLNLGRVSDLKVCAKRWVEHEAAPGDDAA